MDIKPDRERKTRVLVDLDGVIRDFIGSLSRVYHNIYPDHKILPVNSRKLEDFFPAGEKIYDFMEPGNVEEIMQDAGAYPDAVEALHRWKDEFEIVIVTAQPDLIKASTYIWIGKHDLPTREVHITYAKSEIRGVALLDDFTDNLEEFARTDRLAICLDQPWNQHWGGSRVKSVDEFFRKVQAYLYQNNISNNNQQNLT